MSNITITISGLETMVKALVESQLKEMLGNNTALPHSSEDCENLKDELESARVEIGQLKESNKSLEEDRDQYKNQLETKTKEAVALSEAKKKLEDEVKDLKEKLERQKQENQQLSTSNSKLADDLLKVQKTNKDLMDANEKREEDYNDLREKYDYFDLKSLYDRLSSVHKERLENTFPDSSEIGLLASSVQEQNFKLFYDYVRSLVQSGSSSDDLPILLALLKKVFIVYSKAFRKEDQYFIIEPTVGEPFDNKLHYSKFRISSISNLLMFGYRNNSKVIQQAYVE